MFCTATAPGGVNSRWKTISSFAPPVDNFTNSQMVIGAEFPRSSQFKKFLSTVLHRYGGRGGKGEMNWWKIGSVAPPGGGNALT